MARTGPEDKLLLISGLLRATKTLWERPRLAAVGGAGHGIRNYWLPKCPEVGLEPRSSLQRASKVVSRLPGQGSHSSAPLSAQLALEGRLTC